MAEKGELVRRGRVFAVAAALPLLLMAAAPQGLAAGKKLTTTLTGVEEEPGPGDSNATGSATLRLNSGKRTVCFKVSWADVDGTVTAAHIHKAPAGDFGSVVVLLFEGEYAGTDSESGCVTAARRLIKQIRKNPSDYYVNVHSTDFPAGAVRGQLGD